MMKQHQQQQKQQKQQRRWIRTFSFSSQVVLFFFIQHCFVEGSNAFTIQQTASTTSNRAPSHAFRRTERARIVTSSSLLRGGASDDNTEDLNPINQGQLVSTLAKLDQQWKIQQRASPSSRKNNKLNRWTKLELTDESDDDSDTNDVNSYDSDVSAATASTAATKPPKDFVYLLEPPATTTPSCIILFLGGAGLGQYPHIAYDEFLYEISNKLSATVISAPYSVGLNHFDLAKQSGELLRRGKMQYCETTMDNNNNDSSRLPVFVLGHSLGCKLLTIYLAATSTSSLGNNVQGIGFISFNNYSFSDTITMARELADRLLSTKTGPTTTTTTLMNSVLDFASQAVTFMGLEFTPSPADMKRLIGLKYDVAHKTRLFTLVDDTLDTTDDFVSSLPSSERIAVSTSPGNHLTPVYLSFQLKDYMNDNDMETAGIPPEIMTGGFQGASFGNQNDMKDLVQQVVNFCLGKPNESTPPTDPLFLAAGSSNNNNNNSSNNSEL